jgi:hypothetical protein
MLLTPKLAAAGLVSSLLLTGCSVNAPVGPFDIHDNVVNNPSVTVPSDSISNFPQAPSLPTSDPNAPQDLPDPWGEDDVDPITPGTNNECSALYPDCKPTN